MGLMHWALAGMAGYACYRVIRRERGEPERAAFAGGETANRGSFTQVRNAGPEAMRSDLTDWDKTDEASDESFPASDPPGSY